MGNVNGNEDKSRNAPAGAGANSCHTLYTTRNALADARANSRHTSYATKKPLRRKRLEIILQRIPPQPSPSPRLEQYATPATTASDILYVAHGFGDIAGKRVADLGCGTGIFAIGAALLGAEEVTGIDIDGKAIKLAKEQSNAFGLKNISFHVKDILDFGGAFDTVFQNPPFGSQNKGADIPFLTKAMEVAQVAYTIHNSVTSNYIRKKIIDSGSVITFEKNYKFEIRHMFRFHKKERATFEVTMFRLENKLEKRDMGE